jgi:hypothetical protein
MRAFFKPLSAWYWKRRENELWWMESDDGPSFVPIDLVLWMAPWVALACMGWYYCWSWENQLAQEAKAEQARYLQAARQTVPACHAPCCQRMRNQAAPNSPPAPFGAARGLAPER